METVETLLPEVKVGDKFKITAVLSELRRCNCQTLEGKTVTILEVFPETDYFNYKVTAKGEFEYNIPRSFIL